LYKIKETHDKSHPLYTVSKLLLNSLYGRFGMDFDIPFYSDRIVKIEELFDINEHNTIVEIIELSNNLLKIISIS
jgi:hypothetical protein